MRDGGLWSPRRGLVLFLGLCLGGVSQEAAAMELWGTGPLSNSSLKAHNDLEIRYWQVPDRLENFEDRDVLNYFEQVNRLNLLLSGDGLTLGATVDQVALFANRYVLDGELVHERDLYVRDDFVSPWDDSLIVAEKLWMTRTWDGVQVTVGDSYTSFGRGIALNAVKNTDIDVDTSIRGARIGVSKGDIDATLVSGLTNTQQIAQDNPNVGITAPVTDMVSGAQLTHYGLGPIQAGVHGALFRFGREPDRDLDGVARYGEGIDVSTAGVGITVPYAAGIDWYVEGDLFNYTAVELTGAEEGENLQGYAAYASASAYPGKTTVLVEAKSSKDTERITAFTSQENFELSNVPTLEYERVITEDGSAAVNSNDVHGGRVRLDYAAVPGEQVFYLATTVLRDLDTAGLHFNDSPEWVVHPIFGVQWFPDDETVVQLNAGFRRDQRDDAAEGADMLAHIDGELHLPAGHHDAIELAFAARRFFWGVNEVQQTDFTSMENALIWHRGEKLQLRLYQDFTTNELFLIQSQGNITENLFLAGELAWAPKGSSEVRVFYGAYKAGIRCAGGQCRQLPGFEGGRLSWTTQF